LLCKIKYCSQLFYTPYIAAKSRGKGQKEWENEGEGRMVEEWGAGRAKGEEWVIGSVGFCPTFRN